MSHVASNCLRIMFDRHDEAGDGGGTACCDPFFFFHRFRPYISSWSAVFEGQCVLALVNMPPPPPPPPPPSPPPPPPPCHGAPASLSVTAASRAHLGP